MDGRPTIAKVLARKTNELTPTISRIKEQFISREKNPSQLLHEYCSARRLKLVFRPAAMPDLPGMPIGFAEVAVTDGLVHTPGYGASRKEAKAAASHKALLVLLGIVVPVDGDVEERLTQEDIDSIESRSVGSEHDTSFCEENVPTSVSQLERSAVENLRTHNNGTTLDDWMHHLRWESETLDVVEPECAGPAESFPPFRYDADVVGPQSQLGAADLCNNSDNNTNDIDLIAGQFMAMRDELMSQVEGIPVPISNNFAAIVMRNDDEISVIAFGSGSGSIREENLPPSYLGHILHDCHAIVVARRAFMRFLYFEVTKVFEDLSESIFDLPPPGGKLSLKADVEFHVVMSQPPCGFCLEFCGNVEDGLISAHDAQLMESGVHYPNLDVLHEGATRWKKSGLSSGQKSKHFFQSVSCTDKILKWNVLGAEGSLLGTLVNPIYLDSFNFLSRYEHGYITRGICCRNRHQSVRNLPPVYRHNHPWIGRTTRCEPVPRNESPSHLSANWCSYDTAVELVDPLTGRVSEYSPFKLERHPGESRLCKQAFFNRYQSQLRRINNTEVIKSYRDAKSGALRGSGQYESARLQFVQYLLECGDNPSPSREKNFFTNF